MTLAAPRRALLAALAVGVAMALLAVLAEHVLVLDAPSEEAYLDRLFRSRSGARAGADETVMVVHFDRKTFTALGTTWNEFAPHLTRLVELLRQGGAKVIGMDMGVSFLDAGPSGSAFLEACAQAGNVVFTSVVARDAPEAAPVSKPVTGLVARAAVPTGFANFVAGGKGQRENRGGVIRAVSLETAVGSRTVRSFALEVARRALGVERPAVEPGRCTLGARSVPLEDGLLRLDYPGGSYFQSIGAEAFLGENSKLRDVSMRVVAGKTVLVGADYQAMGDHHATPFGVRAGVTIQAAAVRTLVAGRPLRPLPAWLGPLLALAMALFAGALFARFPRGPALAGALAAPLVLHVGALAAFEAGVWVPAFFAIATAPVAGLVLWGLDPRRGTEAAPVLDATQVAGSAAPRDWGEGDLVLRVARDVVSSRYKDVEMLGRGGMGVVLRAFDPQRNKHVAVKILSPLLSDRPHLVKRFMHEIRALKTVAHPGVVEILDVEEAGQTPYYSMELIEGIDLRARLRDAGTFEDGEAQAVFGQLWDVLAHIHSHGVIHRDIKPDNILLTKDGRVKLLDFGLAHVPEASALTQEGEVMGTLRYMSPEQMEGRELTAASDVFSAALVVFEAMTGRMPFPEIGRVLNHSGTITNMAALRPALRPGISELITTCLSPVPEARPPDAGRVAKRWAAIWLTPDATLPGRLS